MLKQVDALQHGNDVDEQMQYLASDSDPNKSCSATGDDFLEASVQLEIYASRARRLILKAHEAVRGSAKTPAEVWNEHMILTISASRAHVEFMVLKSSTTYLVNLPKTTSESLRVVLTRLRTIFALSNIINPHT